jgi:hypothetical protein
MILAPKILTGLALNITTITQSLNPRTLIFKVFWAVNMSQLHKISSSGLEPRTDYRGCGFSYRNLLLETNNFDLDAVFIMHTFRATGTQ